MSTYRNRPQRDYTIIRNAALRDKTLNLKAKGLLALMLTFPAGWTYHQKHLETLSADGRDALRKAVRDLEKAGYITRSQSRNEDGTLGAAEYHVTDDVRTVDGFSVDGKTDDGLSDDGKPAPIKTDSKKTDLKKTELSKPSPDGDPYELIRRAYNEHRGPLPECRVMNAKRKSLCRAAIRDLGTAEEVAAALAIAAAEVANDPRKFYEKNGYGFNELMTGQKFIGKAEAAMNRGGVNREAGETKRMLQALRGAA